MEVKEFWKRSAAKIFTRRATVERWTNPEFIKVEYVVQKELLRCVMKQIDWNAKSILDIGTGTGRFAIPAALNGGDVYAIDISMDMLKRAKIEAEKANVNVEFCLGDAEQLPFKTDFFDVIICIETFAFLPNPQKACLQIANVVSQGGKAIIQIQNKITLARFLQGIFRKIKSSPSRSPIEIKNAPKKRNWEYTVTELREFLKEVGLKVTKTRGLGLFGGILMFTTPKIFVRFLRVFINWFFENVEEYLRESPLLYAMTKVTIIATK